MTYVRYGFKAGLLKSFGFGQVGGKHFFPSIRFFFLFKDRFLITATFLSSFLGEVLIIHPDYVLAQLTPPQLAHYAELRSRRKHIAFRHWQDALCGKKSFLRVKDEAPYAAADESKVTLF